MKTIGVHKVQGGRHHLKLKFQVRYPLSYTNPGKAQHDFRSVCVCLSSQVYMHLGAAHLSILIVLHCLQAHLRCQEGATSASEYLGMSQHQTSSNPMMSTELELPNVCSDHLWQIARSPNVCSGARHLLLNATCSKRPVT